MSQSSQFFPAAGFSPSTSKSSSRFSLFDSPSPSRSIEQSIERPSQSLPAARASEIDADTLRLIQERLRNDYPAAYRTFFPTKRSEGERTLFVSPNDASDILNMATNQMMQYEQSTPQERAAALRNPQWLFHPLIDITFANLPQVNGLTAVAKWKPNAKVVFTSDDYKGELPATQQLNSYAKKWVNDVVANQSRGQKQREQDFRAAVNRKYYGVISANPQYNQSLSQMSDATMRSMVNFIANKLADQPDFPAVKMGRPTTAAADETEAAKKQKRAEANAKYQAKQKEKAAAAKRARDQSPPGNVGRGVHFAPLRRIC